MLLLALPGLSKLSVTPDNRVFYGGKDKYFQELLAFENLFASNTRVAFVTTCQQPIENCPSLQESVRWLAQESASLPYTTRVDSLDSFPTLVSTNDSVSSFSTLDYVCAAAHQCDPEKLERFNDPLVVGRYIDPTRSTVATLVSLDLEVGSVHAVSTAYAAAQALLTAHREIWSELDIRYVGTVPLMQSFVHASVKDMSSVFALAMLVIVFVLYGCLQSIRLVLIMLTLGLLTIGITMGLAGWNGHILNTATSTLPLVLFTLVTATSMHYFMYLLRSVSDNASWTPAQAAQAAFNTQWKPVLLTTFSTAACMLSLLTVDSPPIYELGLWTAVGVCIGTLLLLLVVPVLCASISRPTPSVWQGYLQRSLNRYARLIERDTIPIKTVLALLMISSGLILSLEVDDDFVRYFDKDNGFRTDTEYVAERLFGPSNLEIQIDSGESDGVYQPSYLSFVQRLTDHVRSLDHVRNVLSFSDIISETNKHFGNGDAPRDLESDLIAQMFMAYEFSLELGQSTTDVVDDSRRFSRVSISLSDISSSQVVALEKSLYEWASLQTNTYDILVTGESIPISHLSSRNIKAMLVSISLTFVFTAILLVLVFRNYRVGLLAFISTVVPVAVGFGFWAIASDTIGLTTTVIISVCIGVVIDDSIHLIYRHFDALRHHDLGSRQAAAFAVHRVGTALITTTVVIVAGFTVLMFSDFQLNFTFAACSSLVLTSALFFDLLISPKLLVWSTKDSDQPE